MELFKAVSVSGDPVFVVARNLKAASDYLAERYYPNEITKLDTGVPVVILEPTPDVLPACSRRK